MDIYTDSPAVVERRAEVDARGVAFGEQGIDLRQLIAAIRQRAIFDFIIAKLGDRDEFELYFLDLLDAEYDRVAEQAEKAIEEAQRQHARAMLLGQVPQVPHGRVMG